MHTVNLFPLNGSAMSSSSDPGPPPWKVANSSDYQHIITVVILFWLSLVPCMLDVYCCRFGTCNTVYIISIHWLPSQHWLGSPNHFYIQCIYLLFIVVLALVVCRFWAKFSPLFPYKVFLSFIFIIVMRLTMLAENLHYFWWMKESFKLHATIVNVCQHAVLYTILVERVIGPVQGCVTMQIDKRSWSRLFSFHSHFCRETRTNSMG